MKIEKKLPILIVLFNPDDEIINSLSNIQSNVNLFIFDNSTRNEKLELIFTDSRYYYSNLNGGISAAMMWMTKECENLGYKYFIFFDQDTRFTLDSIYQISGKLSHCDFPNIQHFTSEKKKSIDIKYIINSGTVFKVEFLKSISYLIDNYFVDALDLMISYQNRMAGNKIVLNYVDGLDHVVGQGFVLWKFFGSYKFVKEYSFERRREFYRGHFRLLHQIFLDRQISDFLSVSKFIIAFTLGQLRVDLIMLFGKKL
jgi:hypothetical protein